MKSIFSRIIDRDVPAAIVYEDDATLAFMDIQPVNPGHVLLIPKKPYADFLEMPASEMEHYHRVLQQVAQAVMEALDADGINLVQNIRSAAGQVVFHMHTHIIPRFEGDGHAPWKGSAYPSDEERERIATVIAHNAASNRS